LKRNGVLKGMATGVMKADEGVSPGESQIAIGRIVDDKLTVMTVCALKRFNLANGGLVTTVAASSGFLETSEKP
jgi:hypothetical protein